MIAVVLSMDSGERGMHHMADDNSRLFLFQKKTWQKKGNNLMKNVNNDQQ